jgi:hypothetical protein
MKPDEYENVRRPQDYLVNQAAARELVELTAKAFLPDETVFAVKSQDTTGYTIPLEPIIELRSRRDLSLGDIKRSSANLKGQGKRQQKPRTSPAREADQQKDASSGEYRR